MEPCTTISQNLEKNKDKRNTCTLSITAIFHPVLQTSRESRRFSFGVSREFATLLIVI